MDHFAFSQALFIGVLLTGGAVGSFINVLVYRWPRDLSALRPSRSFCPACRGSIAWYDNIPLISWLVLRGRCRACKSPIPVRYPVVEGLGVFLFGATYYWHVLAGAGPQYDLFTIDTVVLLARLVLVAVLLAVVLIDGEFYVIPRALSLPPLLIGLSLALALPSPTPDRMPIMDLEQASAIGTLVLGGGGGLLLSQVLLWAGFLPRSYEVAPDLERRLDEKSRRTLELAEQHGYRPSQLTEEQWQALEEELPPDLSILQSPEFRHRREMSLEALYLLGPVLGALLAWWLWPTPHWITAPWCRGLLASGLGLLVGGGLHWYVRLVFTVALDRVALGLGDVRLMAGIGAMLGWFPTTLGFLLAPAVALPFLPLLRWTRLGKPVPFGPWLCVGTFAAMLLGENLWNGESGVAAAIAGLSQLLRAWITGQSNPGEMLSLYHRWTLLLILSALGLFLLAALLLSLIQIVARRAKARSTDQR